MERFKDTPHVDLKSVRPPRQQPAPRGWVGPPASSDLAVYSAFRETESPPHPAAICTITVATNTSFLLFYYHHYGHQHLVLVVLLPSL